MNKVKILLIEDNNDLRQLWEILFNANGFDMKTFSNSDDFLLQHGLIKDADIIITDYHLDRLTGIELAQTVRESYPDKIFFFFTGSGDDKVIREINSMENTVLCMKPVNFEKVKSKISELLSNSPKIT